jgi:hypothetical protein
MQTAALGRRHAIAAGRRCWEDHSRATAGGGPAAGESWTGADAADVRGGFGAGGFLAAAGGGTAAEGGGGAAAAERGGGSGFMMLTGGVEAAVGKSALVGLPTSGAGPSDVASPCPDGVAGAGATVVAAGACPWAATAGPAAGAEAAMIHDAA